MNRVERSALAAVVFAAGTGIAPLAAATPESGGTTAESVSAGAAGMVAIVDPTTGRLEVGGKEDPVLFPYDAWLEEATSTEGRDIEVETLPNGGILVHLGRGFQSAVVATVSSDGRLRLSEGFVLAPRSISEDWDRVCD